MAVKVKRTSLPTGVPTIDIMDAANTAEIQNYNNRQVYSKGFSYTTSSGGATTSFNPVLGGKCRKLHGFALYYPQGSISDDDTISLMINEELIIDNNTWRAWSPQTDCNPFKPYQFFELRRALSGSDSVLLSVTSSNAHALYSVFYLSNS